jgi:transposase InsO family protein
MWLGAKEATSTIGINYDTMRQQVRRGNAKFQYRYVEGLGRGGRSLEIWVDDAEIPVTPKPRTLRARKEVQQAPPPPDMSLYLRLDKREQKEILERVELVRSYLNRERWMSYEEWAKDKPNLPTKQHFFRLVRRYRQGEKEQNIVSLFCDRRGRPRGTLKMDEEMREMAENYLISKLSLSDVEIYNNMRHFYGNALPSLDTVCRYLKQFREQNSRLFAYAVNPDKAKGAFQPAYGSQSDKAQYKNQYWELDGTPADIICADGKRPAIIGLIDVFSRRVVLSVEERSNSYSITRNLREGLLKLGIPDNVVVDNGRDYTSNHFESVCQNLQINKHIVPPYSGEKKPHIERFFRTMSHELFQGLEGFIGHNVAERSAIQNSLSFGKKLEAIKKWRSQRHNSATFSKAMASKETTLPLFIPLTMDELRHWLNGWVETIYEQRVHSRLKMTPMEKYSSDITPARMIADERTLDVLLGEWLLYTVSKRGIVVRRDGVEALYQHPKLIEYTNEKVYVVLGADMSEAYVYSSEMAPICAAKDESLAGYNREAIKKVHAEFKRLQKMDLQRIKKADELVKKYPTIKDVITDKLGKTYNAPLPKMIVKSDVELPREETLAMNGDRPFFRSDYDALIWAIENGREEEFEALISERSELYEMAQHEVAHRQNKVG